MHKWNFNLRKDFVHKLQDGNGRDCVLDKIFFFLLFHFRLPSHKIHYHNCIWYSYHSGICLDYPKIISEKWNFVVNFNCQQAKIITLLFTVRPKKKNYVAPHPTKIWKLGQSVDFFFFFFLRTVRELKFSNIFQ